MVESNALVFNILIFYVHFRVKKIHYIKKMVEIIKFLLRFLKIKDIRTM